VIFLLGCGFGLTDPSGNTPAGDDSGAVLTIDHVDPGWGLTDSDTELTITGSGFEQVSTVNVGYADVSFTVVDDGTLVTTAPALFYEETVEITLAGGGQTASAGFQYTNEDPDTDTDTDVDADTDADADTDTDLPGAGKTGGLLQLSLVQIACPDCIGATSDLEVSAQAGFHDPERGGWLDWLPSEGACVTDPSITSPASSFLDAGEWLYLTSGSRSVALRSATDNIFAADGLDEADFVRNAAYDLQIPSGGADIDAFSVTDAITTPQAISELTPLEILYTTTRDAFSARISRSGTTFTWGPSGGSGTFLVVLTVYNSAGTALLGEVTCRGADNGRMNVPSSALNFPNGSLVLVGMYRYTIGSFERPDDGSSVDTVASFGVLGTGSISP
jgi:hypothetical protein